MDLETGRTPDECIAEIWEIANAQADYCEPFIRAWSDQWWAVSVECAHGKFRGESQGLIDMSTAYRQAAGEFRRAHTVPAAVEDEVQLWPPVEWALERLGENWRAFWRSYRKARCARLGHKNKGDFAGDLERSGANRSIAGQARCVRCGEWNDVEIPREAVRPSHRVP